MYVTVCKRKDHLWPWSFCAVLINSLSALYPNLTRREPKANTSVNYAKYLSSACLLLLSSVFFNPRILTMFTVSVLMLAIPCFNTCHHHAFSGMYPYRSLSPSFGFVQLTSTVPNPTISEPKPSDSSVEYQSRLINHWSIGCPSSGRVHTLQRTNLHPHVAANSHTSLLVILPYKETLQIWLTFVVCLLLSS